MTTRARPARPPATSAHKPLEVELEAPDGALARGLLETGARLGLVVRIVAGARRLTLSPEDTMAHALRTEAVASVRGAIDLEVGASIRARRALAGLAGSASSRSAALLREESDGRLTLHVRDKLPVDLGEPPEAGAALRAARARRATAPSATTPVAIPDDAEARAREITFGPTRTLSDPSSRRVLEAFGIQATPWRLAESAPRATVHARALGYPVDLRVASPDVSAIDDPRLQALELRSPGEVREGFRSIARELRKTAPNARTLGVTVGRHVAGLPLLRVSLERGTTDRLRVALDDAVGRRLTRASSFAVPADTAALGAALGAFEGRDALPDFDSPAGRALLDAIARFSRLSLILSDTLMSAEMAPLAPSGDGWLVLGARISVRGVDVGAQPT